MVTIKTTTIVVLFVLALGISFALSLLSGSASNQIIKDAYGTEIERVPTNESGTNMSESRLDANLTLSNVAFYSCTLPGPVTIPPQGIQAIYCPVNAILSDNAIATVNNHIVEVLSATPMGNIYGDVLIWIKNDFNQSYTFGDNPYHRISIMIFSEARPVTGCAAPCR